MNQPTRSFLNEETKEEIREIVSRNGSLPRIAHKGLNAFDYICGFRKKATAADWSREDMDEIIAHAMSGGYDELYEIFYMTSGKEAPGGE